MKRGNVVAGRRSSPKQSLNLPDLDQAKSAVLNSLPSKESQRRYRHAIDEFIGGTAPNPGYRSTKGCDSLSNPPGITPACAGHH